MHRSSLTVWKMARENSGTPECPEGISEPSWANLAYYPHCHVCANHCRTCPHAHSAFRSTAKRQVLGTSSGGSESAFVPSVLRSSKRINLMAFDTVLSLSPQCTGSRFFFL